MIYILTVGGCGYGKLQWGSHFCDDCRLTALADLLHALPQRDPEHTSEQRLY